METKPSAAQIEAKFAALSRFLPDRAYPLIKPYLLRFPIFLKITKERKTVLGDYRPPFGTKRVHQISINGNLNRYSFLITLLHELAHLEAHVRYRRSIAPHGKEWKALFKQILSGFLGCGIFPADIEIALLASLEGMKASTCSDPNLYRVLKRYDEGRRPDIRFVEELPADTIFQTTEGRMFRMIGKIRSRYRCEDIKSGREYYFHPLVEVVPAS